MNTETKPAPMSKYMIEQAAELRLFGEDLTHWNTDGVEKDKLRRMIVDTGQRGLSPADLAIRHGVHIEVAMDALKIAQKPAWSRHYDCLDGAIAKARIAALRKALALGGDIGACGFAWARFRNGKEQVVHAMRYISFGSKAWDVGWEVWNPSGAHWQNVDVKEAGAKAFSHYMALNGGYSTFWGSRLD